MSNTPESETESVVGDDTVTIHRAPRYLRFMIAGAVVGLIVALVLTLAFPEPPGFDYSQVLGFLGLFFGVAGFALGAVVALLVDRASRRAAKTIDVELIEGRDVDPEPTQQDSTATGSSSLERAATEPAPTEPAATASASIESAPTKQTPIEPTPIESAPIEPDATDRT